MGKKLKIELNLGFSRNIPKSQEKTIVENVMGGILQEIVDDCENGITGDKFKGNLITLSIKSTNVEIKTNISKWY